MRRFLLFFIVLILSALSATATNQIINASNMMAELTLRTDAGLPTNYSQICRWNITAFPAGIASFQDVKMCRYIVANTGNPTGQINCSMSYDVWDDGTAISAIRLLSFTNATYLTQVPLMLAAGKYACFNITDDIREAYFLNQPAISFRGAFLDYKVPMASIAAKSTAYARMGQDTSSIDRYIVFETRDNDENTGNLPFINATYTLGFPVQIHIDIPQNATYYTHLIPLLWGYNFTAVNCSYNLDGNKTAFSGNITMNISAVGNHKVNITCVDGYYLTNISSVTVSFSIIDPCSESWRMTEADCIEGYSFLTYNDANNCDSSMNISMLFPPNGTYRSCEGRSVQEGEYYITYDSYPYVSLASDNPLHIYLELAQNGTLTIFPNITLQMTSQRTGIQYNFTLAKDVPLTRYNISLLFNASDANDNFTLLYSANVVGIGNVTNLIYVRNNSCTVQFRLWNDRNQSSPYRNEFMQVLAKPRTTTIRYTLPNYIMLVPLYDKTIGKYFTPENGTRKDLFGPNFTINTGFTLSEESWFHAPYRGGLANLTLYDSDDYSFKVIDGSFIFLANYGPYLSETKDIDTDLGVYSVNCNPNVVQVRDYYVSRFDLHFFESTKLLLWLALFILLAFVVAWGTLAMTGSIQFAGFAFIGVLAMLVSIFFGINLMGILFTNFR